MVALAEASMILSCLRYGKPMAVLIFSALLFFLGACFLCLQITVDETFLQLRFGIGIIRKAIPLDTIQSYTRIRNSLLSGWGIRHFKRGMIWLYSVSGFDAVELLLKNGQKIRIGTDDPVGLVKALQVKIG